MFTFLHTNGFYFYSKIQLHMFQVYLCVKLSYVQTISSHYTLSLLHISKMTMNVTTTLQLMVEYSTCLLFLLLSTLILHLFFSIILLPPLAFICAHSFALHFPLLLSIVFQWHFLHSCCYELQNFKNAHNF